MIANSQSREVQVSNLVKLEGLEALTAPPRADLLLARRAIHASPELQQLFDDAATQGWEVDRLASAIDDGLRRALGTSIGAATALFLAEEFEARDKQQTLLVSADTGLAVAQVPPDALYQPDPVAREGTDQLATPLMRLKPEVEAAIVQHHYRRAEDRSLTAKLQQRARSSELQKAEGDARFRIATRSGRTSLAEQLRGELPTLLSDHRGASGRLLRLCRLNEPVPSSHSLTLEWTLFSQVSMLVADGLANNLRHDSYGSARGRIRAGWTRSLAKAIATLAHLKCAKVHVRTRELGPEGLLIAEPNAVAMGLHAKSLFTVEAPSVLLNSDVYLTFRSDYRLDAYESQARWNLDASIDVCMHLDPEAVSAVIFTDVVESGVSVEVLP
jgi:hypothetical protein